MKFLEKKKVQTLLIELEGKLLWFCHVKRKNKIRISARVLESKFRKIYAWAD
jgi:hypothetical protein